MFIDWKDGLIEWILDRFIPYRVYTSFMTDNLFAPVAQQCISKEETEYTIPKTPDNHKFGGYIIIYGKQLNDRCCKKRSPQRSPALQDGRNQAEKPLDSA